jgi:hypothetical protein
METRGNDYAPLKVPGVRVLECEMKGNIGSGGEVAGGMIYPR